MLGFMAAYGLTPLGLPIEDLDVNHFFDWLRAFLVMLDTGSKFYGDLSAVVAARTLAASVCSLLPTEDSSPQAISKTQLCSLRNHSFGWPPEEVVRPENLPALPKNIAKNFIESLKNTGADLMKRGGLCLNDQVCLHYHFPFALAVCFKLFSNSYIDLRAVAPKGESSCARNLLRTWTLHPLTRSFTARGDRRCTQC